MLDLNLSNYPDDIRSYDNDFRSPFFTEPKIECDDCGYFFDEEDIDNSGCCLNCSTEVKCKKCLEYYDNGDVNSDGICCDCTYEDI